MPLVTWEPAVMGAFVAWVLSRRATASKAPGTTSRCTTWRTWKSPAAIASLTDVPAGMSALATSTATVFWSWVACCLTLEVYMITRRPATAARARAITILRTL